MIATIAITLVIAGLFALAVRRLVRRGTCSACESQGTCASAGTGHCAPRAADDAGPVVLGMPGGLTRVTSAGAPGAADDCCCAPPASTDDRAHAAATPAGTH